MEQLHPVTQERPGNPPEEPGALCMLCGGTGWKRTEDRRKNDRVTRCACWQREYSHQLLETAEIPARYRGARLDNFQHDGPQASLAEAWLWAQRFVDAYPVHEDFGALLIGTVGTGKTHLAVSVLRGLIERGFGGRFYDYCSLLREIQSTYSPESTSQEIELLRPVFETTVLVLDDLGAMRPSPWVMDTVTLILNTRYNRHLVTLITTNFPDRTAAEPLRGQLPAHFFEHSLSERVGERVVSRLREMCRFVTMDGPDYRMRLQPRALSGRGGVI